jgi:hypothetical protein
LAVHPRRAESAIHTGYHNLPGIGTSVNRNFVLSPIAIKHQVAPVYRRGHIACERETMFQNFHFKGANSR